MAHSGNSFSKKFCAKSPFKMNDGKLKKVAKELHGAVKAHGKQANIIEQHIKDMENKKGA